MLAVCGAGRILHPKSARNQVIGRHDHGAPGRRWWKLAVGEWMGFFVKHVLAGYEVTVERQRANAPLNYSASGAAFMVSQRDTFRSKRSPRVASNGGPPDEAVATVGFDQVTVKVQR